LSMAISNRKPDPTTVIHSDHGVQFTSWALGTGPRVRAGSVHGDYR
jgi:transposase InsO family protein